ncbi:MAG: hypothetical protein JEY96_02575 [Bacteroidales bacterium]|nr:hypothetical protein [Bacteroidales bacterium]
MKTFFNLLVVIILLSSCNMMNGNDKNDKFYLDDSHLKDENILNEKKQVIEFLKAFNEWYQKAGAKISLAPSGWYMDGHNEMTHKFRINYIKTKVLEEVEKTNLLSKILKERVIMDIQTLDDPENLGTLILDGEDSYKEENEFGTVILHGSKQFGSEFTQFIQFESNSYLMNYSGFNIKRDDMEGTYEELESYYLKMIRLGEVIKYNFPYNVVMGDNENYYVNVFIIKEDGNYKVDKIEVKPFKKDKD